MSSLPIHIAAFPLVPIIIVVVLVDGAAALLGWAIYKYVRARSSVINPALDQCEAECATLYPYGSEQFDNCVNKCYEKIYGKRKLLVLLNNPTQEGSTFQDLAV